MENKDLQLRIESISKSYNGVLANNDISFELVGGEVLAVVGHNGAGKTTLVSILAGQLQPDSGDIYLNSEKTNLYSPDDAIRKGIGVVYQENKLVDALNVFENILLSKKVPFFTRKKTQLLEIEALLKEYGLTINLDRHVNELSMGEKQQVEIVKALYQESNLLIFDEPTSSLNQNETEFFFLILSRLKQKKKNILFISHNLEDVKRVADRVCILKSGKVEDIKHINKISINEISYKMVGKVTRYHLDKKTIRPKQIVLQAKNITTKNLKKISVSIRQGEIFSVVGMAGNGQKELIEALTNRSEILSGEYSILGESSYDFFRKKGWSSILSYIPEDRFNLATDKNLNILDTFLLTTQYGFSESGWLQKEHAREKAEELIENFKITATDTEMLAGELSGGNLQKLILARAFFNKPKVMIVEQPTQGLDISSTHEIWQLLLNAREQTGLLVVSTDLSEAVTISDKIGIMYKGKIVEIIDTTDHDKVDHLAELIVGQEVFKKGELDA